MKTFGGPRVVPTGGWKSACRCVWGDTSLGLHACDASHGSPLTRLLPPLARVPAFGVISGLRGGIAGCIVSRGVPQRQGVPRGREMPREITAACRYAWDACARLACGAEGCALRGHSASGRDLWRCPGRLGDQGCGGMHVGCVARGKADAQPLCPKCPKCPPCFLCVTLAAATNTRRLLPSPPPLPRHCG